MAADGLLFVPRLRAGTASSPRVTEKVDFPPTPPPLSGAFSPPFQRSRRAVSLLSIPLNTLKYALIR